MSIQNFLYTESVRDFLLPHSDKRDNSSIAHSRETPPSQAFQSSQANRYIRFLSPEPPPSEQKIEQQNMKRLRLLDNLLDGELSNSVRRQYLNEYENIVKANFGFRTRQQTLDARMHFPKLDPKYDKFIKSGDENEVLIVLLAYIYILIAYERDQMDANKKQLENSIETIRNLKNHLRDGISLYHIDQSISPLENKDPKINFFAVANYYMLVAWNDVTLYKDDDRRPLFRDMRVVLNLPASQPEHMTKENMTLEQQALKKSILKAV
jgi:hypothetical protein